MKPLQYAAKTESIAWHGLRIQQHKPWHYNGMGVRVVLWRSCMSSLRVLSAQLLLKATVVWEAYQRYDLRFKTVFRGNCETEPVGREERLKIRKPDPELKLNLQIHSFQSAAKLAAILQIILGKCSGKHLCCQCEGQDFLDYKRTGENQLKCRYLLCWLVNLVKWILTSMFWNSNDDVRSLQVPKLRLFMCLLWFPCI